MADQRWRVAEGEAGVRLDKWLAAPARAGSRSRAATAVERGQVFVNGAEADLDGAARLLSAGDEVRWWVDRPGSAHRRAPRKAGMDELPVVYEDDTLLVVNKPAGLLTVKLDARAAAPTLVDGVRRYLRARGKLEPLVVHRIDRDTSGLVVFAKSAAAHADLIGQFERREPERVYWAVVHGVPAPPEGTWSDALVWDGADLTQRVGEDDDPESTQAVSRYRVIERFGEAASLVEVRLVTGKRNQIRVQAASHGHPLVGERQYLGDAPPAVSIPFSRQALHARALTLAHPVSHRPVRAAVDPPPDFRKLLRTLRAATDPRR